VNKVELITQQLLLTCWTGWDQCDMSVFAVCRTLCLDPEAVRGADTWRREDDALR